MARRATIGGQAGARQVKAFAVVIIAGACWLASGCREALACGHCVEDRIAAVYDHALVQRTAASGQRLAYFALAGKLVPGEAARRDIASLAERTPGVSPGSARVSMEPGALAVAFDPRRSSAGSIETALRANLQASKLSLKLLQPPRADAPAAQFARARR